MNEINYSSSYGSGWRKLRREESDSGMNKSALINHIKEFTEEKTSLYEENQKEIMNELIKLQNEMASMKELLNNIQTDAEMIKEMLHKNTTSRKLTKFFR